MHFSEFIAEFFLGAPGIVFAAVWGALWGSFFNVVIVRLPKEMSLVRPPSTCFSCQQPVRFYDNIPVFSYLLLRGRCRHCKTRFSPRYMLVEILAALLAVAMYRSFVIPEPDLAIAMPRFFITTLFTGLCIAISFIDLDTMRIPNLITYPGIPVFAALSLFMGHPRLYDGALGAVGGYLLIRLLADGWELATGRQGMGYGDAKLLAMIGGLLGWQAIMPVLFAASLQGSVIGITALIWVRRFGGSGPDETGPDETGPDETGPDETGPDETGPDETGPNGIGVSESMADQVGDGSELAVAEDADPPAGASLRTARIPFGPFLCLAAVELLALWPHLPRLLPWFSL